MSNIIGCGSGRCGTMSLANLIDGCRDWTCTHEKEPHLTWDVAEDDLERRAKFFHGNPKVGDVAVYYLPYIKQLFERLSDLKVICLQREKRDTIRSFFAKMHVFSPPRNLWVPHRNDGTWTRDEYWEARYPTFDLSFKGETTRDRFLKTCIEKYWEFYYKQAEGLSDLFSNFKIFPTSILNTKGGQETLFDFLKIENPKFNVGITSNKLVHDEKRPGIKQIVKRIDRYKEEE